MCDLNREFELQIWRDSIEFGKINKGTLSFSNVSENNKEIKIKGEINNAFVGRFIKRTTASSK